MHSPVTSLGKDAVRLPSEHTSISRWHPSTLFSRASNSPSSKFATPLLGPPTQLAEQVPFPELSVSERHRECG